MCYSNLVCLFVTCENFLKFSVNFSKRNTSLSKGEFIWKIKHNFVIFFVSLLFFNTISQRGPTTGPRNNFVRPAEQVCTIQVLSIISSGNLL